MGGTVTAKAEGADGNLIELVFVDSGAVTGNLANVVSVIDHTITVDIDSADYTGTRFDAVKTAIDGDTDAAEFLTLTDGARAAATLELQEEITFTAQFEGADTITIELQGGGTAGSEVVSVASGAITVTIENGVSTDTQVKTAIENSTEASSLVSVDVTVGTGVPLTDMGGTPAPLIGGAGGGIFTVGTHYIDETSGTGGSVQSSIGTRSLVDGLDEQYPQGANIGFRCVVPMEGDQYSDSLHSYTYD